MGEHDSLFKRTFSVPAHAAGEIRSLLPEAITARMDFESLRAVPASFVDPDMAHRHADLLFEVSVGGGPGYVYFLFEHQSEPDLLMPLRVLNYQTRIWDACVRDLPRRRFVPPIG